MKPAFEELKDLENYDLVPVYEEILSDFTTPMNVLRNVSTISDRFYLLESVDASKFSRYSYIGYNPVLSISCKDHYVSLNHDTYYSDRPMEEIKNVLKQYKAKKINDLPPFCGGLVGYASYDSYKYFEPKLEIKSEDYSKFNDYEFYMFDKVICFDMYKQKIIIIVNIKTGPHLKANYMEAKNTIEEIKKLLYKTPEFKQNKVKILEEPKSIDSIEEYQMKIEKIKKHIYDGDIFQCVFSRRFKGKAEGDLFETYRYLRSINPSPYMYYLKYENLEIVGSSPETLCQKEGSLISTYPIAGTRKRGLTEYEDNQLEKELLQDEKELAEHNMLVDLGRNDIGRVSKFGSVKVIDYMKILRFSHVMHIASTVIGTVKEELSSIDVLRSILPAGTLSGAPKLKAVQIIDSLEKERRGIYGGALGYIDFTDNMNMCIVIRTIIKKNNDIYLQAGGGIVMDSEVEKEFEETKNKAMATFKALNM